MTNTAEPTVPWLRSGTGETPADGGCILQVIDWVDRLEWTDSPPCVHPVLAALAIRANDNMDDRARQQLLGLAPRLMGTASYDPVLAVRLAVFCARYVLPVFEAARPGDGRPRLACEAAELWADAPSETAADAAAAYAADAAYAAHTAAGGAAAAAYAADAAAGGAAAAADDAADAAAATTYAVAAAYADIYDLLLGALNEHDRLTSRTTSPAVDLSPVAHAMAGAPNT
jgi:hypothetical protein